MIRSVLVVCVGNICRSPVGERLIAYACPELRVESAGIAALVGAPADETTSAVAAASGLDLSEHTARQFTPEMAAEFDLILALEKGHMRVIAEKAPAVSGKTMLLGHWLSESDIADPYRKSRDFHELVFAQIAEASAAWAKRLGGK